MNLFPRPCTMASLVLATALLALPAVSDAECGCKHKQCDHPAYADLDADGDGRVTSDEFHAFHSARMAERAKEGHKMKHAHNAPTFEDLDLDGDGNLSDEEFAQHHSMCPATKPD